MAENLNSLDRSAETPETNKRPQSDKRKKKAEHILRLYHQGVEGMLRAGSELRDMKAEILGTSPTVEDYREWRTFYETLLKWPKQQVHRLIDVATAFREHLDVASKFDLSALYLLSRAPTDIQDKAIERATNGEFITHRDAQQMLGRKKGKNRSKPYRIDLPNGAIIVEAPHRKLVDVRTALEAALAIIQAKIDKHAK